MLTVSPFYHYNSANYDSSPNDTPIATTDDRASNYGGGQATLSAALPRNNISSSASTASRSTTANFSALIFNDRPAGTLAQCLSADRETVGQRQCRGGFIDDKFSVTSWLTLIGGMRPTHFSASRIHRET